MSEVASTKEHSQNEATQQQAAVGGASQHDPCADVINTMVARGHASPRDMATMLAANPQTASQMMAALHQKFGNSYVQEVLAIEQAPAHAEVPPAAAAAVTNSPAAHETTGPHSHSWSGPAHLRVTASALNVRTSPSVGDAGNVIGGLEHGALVDSIDREGDWVVITYRGERAYVHGSFVEVVPAKRPTETAAAPVAAHTEAPAVAPSPIAAAKVHELAPTVLPEKVAARAPAHEAAVQQQPEHSNAAETAPAPAPTAAPHAQPVAQTDPLMLRAEYDSLIAAVAAGMDEADAIKELVSFDKVHNHGEISATGYQLLGSMPNDIAKSQLAKVQTKVAVKPAPAAETPAPAAAHLATSPTAAHANAEAPSAAAPAKAAQAPAPAPAAGDIQHGTWTPPAGAELDDAGLAQLGAQLNDPRAHQILQDLAGVVALDKDLNKHLVDKEHAGTGRENMVAGIATIRAQLLSLNPSDPKVHAFTVAVNHRVEAVSPYHSQVNMRTIESGAFTTCNVTSLAMSLETTGRNADSYSAAKRPAIVAVAQKYRGDIVKATNTDAGHEAAWESLRGLRLPDFMELAAIANAINSTNPTDAEISKAALHAVATKTNIGFLANIAADFGATATAKTMPFADEISDFADAQHMATDVLVDARNKAEANPKDKKAQNMYAAAQADQGAKIDGGAIEKKMPLDKYKQTVLAELGPLLDGGCGIIAGCWNHFTHLSELTPDYIKIQDPGLYSRSDRKVLWDEARALKFFWNYVVIR
jgi:hypothetical protein